MFYMAAKLLETTTCHFVVVLEDSLHNYLKRPLKYLTHFQLYIYVTFYSNFWSRIISDNRLSAENRYEDLAIFC